MTIFNDTATPLRLLATRRSGKARDMVAPGPTADELTAILGVAARVPDHGKLAPWRFVTIGLDRRQAFADLLASAYLAGRPEAGRVELQAVRDFAFQAPALVVVVSRPVEPSQIAKWEQQLSAGTACGLLCAAASAAGFVANWLTGWAAYSDMVRDGLGEPVGQIAGFIFIGTPSRPLDERPRPVLADVVRAW